MAIKVGELFATLGIDTGGFSKNLNDANKQLNSTVDNLKNMGSKVSRLGQKLSLGVTAPLAAAGAGILKLASDTGAFAEQINNMTQSTGLSAQRLQELKFVADNAGLSFETVANASTMVQRKLMGVEDDSGKCSEVFKKLGINVHDSSGKLLSMDSLFPQIISKLQGMSNQTERNMYAMQIFGGKTAELAPILGMSAKEFEAATKQAHEFGNVLSDEALAKAAKFDDTMDAFNKRIEGLKNTLGTALIDKLGSLIEWFTKLPAPIQGVVLVFGGLIALCGPILMFVGSMITAWGTVIAVAPAVATAATSAWVAITGPVGLVIAAIALVAAGAYLLYKNWDKVKGFFGKLWDGIKTIFSTFWEWVKGLFLKYHPLGILISHWDTVTQFFSNLWDKVYDLTVGKFLRIVNWIKEKVASVGGFFKDLYDKLVGHSVVPDLVNGIQSQMQRLGGNALVVPVQQATNKANSAFSNLSAPSVGSAAGGSSSGSDNRIIALLTENNSLLRQQIKPRLAGTS